jgi:SAM-dependent methyltransferase
MSTNAQYQYAQFYDLFVPDRTDPSDPSITFFLHYALKAGNALDLGAGTGRIALGLAQHRIPVVAIEPSYNMRFACLVKAAQLPAVHPYFTLLAGSAESFSLQQRFSLIYASGVCMHWLGTSTWQAVLSRVNTHLNENGLFILDGIVDQQPPTEDEPMRVVSSRHIGEVLYQTSFGGTWLDDTTYRFSVQYDVIHKGEVVEQFQEHSIRSLMTLEELSKLLVSHGFTIVSVFGDYQFGEHNSSSQNIIVVAQKLNEMTAEES